jgi:fumarate reductase subunit C
MPSSWWSTSRIRTYLLFDATGLIYFMIGFLALRQIWALGDGAEAWGTAMAQLASPLYIGFHVITLLSLIFVGVRFFRLFPKAQPPRIGPAKPPPGGVIQVALYLVWLGVTLVFVAILAGGIF